MQTSNFKLITIAEIKTKYPFLIEDEKFDYFDDWEDEDFFLTAEEDVNFEGNFYLDLYEDKEKKWLANLLNLPIKKVEEIRIEGVLINGNFSV
ncbi:MAG: polymer-forming cytoskeletal protein, partial [Flavobacterium sp.]